MTEREKEPKPVEIRVDYMFTPMLTMAARGGSRVMFKDIVQGLVDDVLRHSLAADPTRWVKVRLSLHVQDANRLRKEVLR